MDGLAMQLSFSPTNTNDAEALVAMRMAAMRDSLERIGRFDPQRARERFLAAFEPTLCRFIEADGARVGFVLVRPQADHQLLDHLYVLPEHQGRGIGAQVLREIFASADAVRLPVRVGALRGSDSNRFYRRHGFAQVSESEWDIYYERQPAFNDAPD
jgi:ribosomal protein S18 acetylase RimI-like enzyme